VKKLRAYVEQAVLGAVLVNNEAMQRLSDLVVEDFADPLHREVFAALRKRISTGNIATPVTLIVDFKDELVGDGFTVKQYLARLAAEATHVAKVKAYAAFLIAVARPDEPKPKERTTAVEIAAKALCSQGRNNCACDSATCTAEDLFGTDAVRVIGALRKAGLIDTAKEAALLR
jgi:hypothetical protein